MAPHLFEIDPSFFQDILYDGKKIKISSADELEKARSLIGVGCFIIVNKYYKSGAPLFSFHGW